MTMTTIRGLYARGERAIRCVPLWNFYLLLKFYLFVIGAINLDIALNLLFLILIATPASERIDRFRIFRFSRGVLNCVLACLLLWHDSWLPPIGEAANLIRHYGIPSFSYIYSFSRGLFSMSLVLVSLALISISILMKKRKVASIALLSLLIVTLPLVPNFNGPAVTDLEGQVEQAEAAEKNPAKYLESFYSTESERMVLFRKPAAASPPFDIVVLHVCSLSWNDLKEIGMTQDAPFFKQFDYLFTNFNSVTGYSGPAVIRLLQASAGQRSHDDVHSNDTPKVNFLFDGLASIGYERYIAMNHDGNYGNYNKALRKNGLNNAKKVTLAHLAPVATFFDDKTALYSDYDVFRKWFDARQASKAERAALYYNSVLLHAGSHWVGERNWSRRDTHDQYKEVTSVLFKDVEKMIDLIKSSKRNTVLILVPEHGRALTGTPFQPPDLRDIPLPKITKVPVAVKLIGPKFNGARVTQHIIAKPTSYFALSWMLSKFVDRSPFGATSDSPEEILFKVPKTDFVAENETSKIIELGGNYLYYGKDKRWITLTPAQLK